MIPFFEKSKLSSPLNQITGDLVKSSLPSHVSQNLLIGSTAQSIEFWPGPSDLRSWDWDQYVKYVTTSLDSFGPRLSQLALRVYPPSLDTVVSSEVEREESVTGQTTSTTATTIASSSVLNEAAESSSSSSSPSTTVRFTTLSSHLTSTSTKPDAMNTKVDAEAQRVMRQGSNSEEVEEEKSRRSNQVQEQQLLHPQRLKDQEESGILSEIDLFSKSTSSMTTTTPKTTTTGSGRSSSSQWNESLIPTQGMKEREDELNDNNRLEAGIESLPLELNGNRKRDAVVVTTVRPYHTLSNESNVNSSEKKRLRRSVILSQGMGEGNTEETNPELVYATMVSDVRQTCPLNRISILIQNSTTASVHRYVITSTPSTSVSIVWQERYDVQ